MNVRRIALVLLLAGLTVLLLPGCDDANLGAEPGTLGDDDDDDDAAPPEPLFDQLLGTIDYEMSYTDGVLEGEECVETYDPGCFGLLVPL